MSLRGGFDALGGGHCGNGWHLPYQEEGKVPAIVAYGPSLIGRFTYAGDLGLKWKHNAYISYSNDDFTLTLSQLFRNGYKNNTAIPGSTSRPDFNRRCENYVIYNMSASMKINIVQAYGRRSELVRY